MRLMSENLPAVFKNRAADAKTAYAWTLDEATLSGEKSSATLWISAATAATATPLSELACNRAMDLIPLKMVTQQNTEAIPKKIRFKIKYVCVGRAPRIASGSRLVISPKTPSTSSNTVIIPVTARRSVSSRRLEPSSCATEGASEGFW